LGFGNAAGLRRNGIDRRGGILLEYAWGDLGFTFFSLEIRRTSIFPFYNYHILLRMLEKGARKKSAAFPHEIVWPIVS
jgi:hypothetical protein